MPVALGIDVGTSAVKVALFDVDTGVALGSANSPRNGELPRFALETGWCEQRALDWWDATCDAIRQLPAEHRGRVAAIGIAYQMHGLVLVDAAGEPTRDAIIWADGRAGACGEAIAAEIGLEAVGALRNQPGNFTLAKMRWVAENEPEALRRAAHALLPGDFVAMKLSGESQTTPGGLSEMIAWDYVAGAPSAPAWHASCRRPDLLPALVPNLGHQARLAPEVAEQLGLPAGTPIAYRAGDQPNNAVALGVLEPGQVAASAGTSGVLFAVADDPAPDPLGRVNTFLHVSGEAPHPALPPIAETLRGEGARSDGPGSASSAGRLRGEGSGSGVPDSASSAGRLRVEGARSDGPGSASSAGVNGNEGVPLGVLLCINGTGALYSWVRATLGLDTYAELNALAEQAPAGSDGLIALPYGNGAERTLGGKPVGAAFAGIDLNRHGRPEIARAALEGIAFALRYGAETLRSLDVPLSQVRAGDAGLFKSALFRQTFASALGVRLELVDTDGALGAARAAAVGAGLSPSLRDACVTLTTRSTTEPQPSQPLEDAYGAWKRHLEKLL